MREPLLKVFRGSKIGAFTAYSGTVFMEQEFKYYIADASGVTAQTLGRAEALATSVQGRMEKLAAFARDRKLELALLWAADQLCGTAFYANADSVIDGKLARLGEGITLFGNYREKLYRPVCQESPPGVCCDFKYAAGEIQALDGYRKIEERIVKEALKTHAAIPAAADLAEVSTPRNTTARAAAYKVLTEWIYRVPVSAVTGQYFVPPQSYPISPENVEKLAFGCPLEDFRPAHRQVWNNLKKLRHIDLG